MIAPPRSLFGGFNELIIIRTWFIRVTMLYVLFVSCFLASVLVGFNPVSGETGARSYYVLNRTLEILQKTYKREIDNLPNRQTSKQTTKQSQLWNKNGWCKMCTWTEPSKRNAKKKLFLVVVNVAKGGHSKQKGALSYHTRAAFQRRSNWW